MRIALSKGYMLKPVVEIFNKVGYQIAEDDLKSRKLIFKDLSGQHEFVIIRPADVPVYVEHGAVDIGIAGKDMLIEGKSSVAELLDLKLGYCRLVVAALKDANISECFPNMRVATKFTKSSADYFKAKDLNVELIKLYGSVELAPVANLADAIIDLTASGKSLEENNLEIVDTIYESTARLVVNKVKLKTNFAEIIDLTQRIQSVL